MATRLVVILAAGAGSRLTEAPDGLPKPLVPVLGMPVLERAVRACGEAGIDRVVVVVGHRDTEVRAWVEEFAHRGEHPEVVVADNWNLGNGASALAARSVVGDSRFLLMMCDHLVSVPLLTRVLESDPQKGGSVWRSTGTRETFSMRRTRPGSIARWPCDRSGEDTCRVGCYRCGCLPLHAGSLRCFT